jgi:S1-C subfamily serine protease
MRGSFRSNLAAAVIGGLVVAGAFLALGVTGRRSKQTVVEQVPLSMPHLSNRAAALTPHQIYLRDAPGVARVQTATSSGSGFLVSRAGYVLTDYHLVEGADPRRGVTVEFDRDAVRPAVVVGASEDDDVAVLRVDAAGLPPAVHPLVLGDSTSVRVGDPTLAIANPFGTDRTLSGGMVAALQRRLQTSEGFAVTNVIQVTPPAAGNSGGPLLDADGRVIGIDSELRVGGGDGVVAFAIPIDTARLYIPGAVPGARGHQRQ